MQTALKSNLTVERRAIQPYEYPEAHDYFVDQQQTHWLWTEFSMASSVNDWELKLTDAEKGIISGTLLGFTQTEACVGSYWANVARWFPKPEIGMMAHSFAAMEAIHLKSYNFLNETLNLEEYDAFLAEPTSAAKLGNLIATPNGTLKERAVSLAVYSGFAEGVSLYSNFAVLLYFSARGLIKELKVDKSAANKYGLKGHELTMPTENLLKGVGEIIAFSVRDEGSHSAAGCWLFRTLREEFPELNTVEVDDSIYEAARITVGLEHDYIDMVFNKTELEDLNGDMVKAFVERRANQKLIELGLNAIFEPDLEQAKEIERWFYIMTGGESLTDFFAARVSNYSKGLFNPDAINWDVVFN